MTLEELGTEINDINRKNGWDVPAPVDWTFRDRVPALLALIHSEVSEALEAFREDDIENFREEIADTIIRCLDVAVGMRLEIDDAISEKLEKNRQRGIRHGGKRV